MKTLQLNSKTLEQKSQSFAKLLQPINEIEVENLESRSNRPLQMNFEDQLKIWVYFHSNKIESGRELLQQLEEDDFAKQVVAPKEGIKRSSFFEAIGSRGQQQLLTIYYGLVSKAVQGLPTEYKELGDLVAVDSTLMQACLSMRWADYRRKAKKARLHMGFNINSQIPSKFVITDGKADEKDYVKQIVGKGQTGVFDRYYYSHLDFDDWQQQEINFVCRIKANTIKTILEPIAIKQGSNIFFDAIVLLGSTKKNQTKKTVRLIGYKVGGSVFWIATNRLDISAEQIALVYKLRWDIECFFGWFKNFMNVYPVLSRSRYGFTSQIIAALVSYMLFVIYCLRKSLPFSVRTLRSWRNSIQNEFRCYVASISNIILEPDSKNSCCIVL